MENTGQIVGGLEIKDVAEGGAVFEIKYNPQTEDDVKLEEECAFALQNYLKLECLDPGESYNGSEPFSSIAEQMNNLLVDGKVKKRILREGYGSKPEAYSTVNINYNAYVQFEAQPFDSTYARKKPFVFVLGEGEVIEGLEIAVLSMNLNEKAQFLIDPELAYRGGGLGRIPPNAQVLFEIELSDVRETAKESDPEMSVKQFQVAYPASLALNIKGKNLFRMKDYQSAIKTYLTAVNKLEDAILNDYDDQVKSEELLVRLYTNLLICCTVAEIPKRGCVFAQKIYQMSKNKTFTVSAKVYFNHAKCVRMLGDFDNARRKLHQARILKPDNEEIKKEFSILQEAKENYKKHEMSVGRSLFR